MSDAPALAGIQHVSDVEAADDFQKKHTPFIDFEVVDGKQLVTVKVGHWVSHPNTPDHFIEWIEIQADGVPLVRFDLTAVATEPNVYCTLALDPGTTIRALESCNLHGVWASEVTL